MNAAGYDIEIELISGFLLAAQNRACTKPFLTFSL